MKNVIISKRITQDDQDFLVVYAFHEEANIYGFCFLPIGECPVTILNKINDGDMSDPMLQEMSAYAVDNLRNKAIAAQEILEVNA